MSKILASVAKQDAPSAADILHRNLATAVVAFQDAVARKNGMGVSEHRCIGSLALLGPVTAGQLARETGFTTGAITGIVDRLERAGHVRREPNPQDRRSVIIHLVDRPERTHRAQQLFQPLTEAMARMRREFSREDLETIYRYLQRTTEVLKEQAHKLEE